MQATADVRDGLGYHPFSVSSPWEYTRSYIRNSMPSLPSWLRIPRPIELSEIRQSSEARRGKESSIEE